MVATLKCNPEVRNTMDHQNQQPDLMYSDITEQQVKDSKGDTINILPFPSPLPILFCSFLKGEKYGPAVSIKFNDHSIVSQLTILPLRENQKK